LPILRYVEMFVFGLISALWLIARHGVHVLVAQSPYEGFAGALAKIIAGFLGRQVALIVENHGDFEESLFLQRRVLIPSLYRFLMRPTARFALTHADLLRAVSNSTRTQLEQWVPNKKIVQFVAWTDIEVFLEAGVNGFKSNNSIVYAGVLIPRKGVHFLVDAFAPIAQEFPNIHLWLIGKAENLEYSHSLKAQVAKLGLNERVVFMDEMPQQGLAKHIAQSIALVLPSVSEALGRVVFEAMACGTLVIGSKVGGIPEMIQEGITGFLVPPGEVKPLEETLRRVLNDPNEAEKMGRLAQEFAREFFSQRVYQKDYAQLFQLAETVLQEGDYHSPTTF
jgi:glycosyltransferase involved in cell wall biosynthesis